MTLKLLKNGKIIINFMALDASRGKEKRIYLYIKTDNGKIPK